VLRGKRGWLGVGLARKARTTGESLGKCRAAGESLRKAG